MLPTLFILIQCRPVRSNERNKTSKGVQEDKNWKGRNQRIFIWGWIGSIHTVLQKFFQLSPYSSLSSWAKCLDTKLKKKSVALFNTKGKWAEKEIRENGTL